MKQVDQFCSAHPLIDVAEFQEMVLKNQMPAKPTYDKAKAKHLLACAREELDELEKAIEADHFPEVVDAVIDCTYFLIGGLYQMGVPFARAWKAVHHANMTKKRGVTHRGVEGDAAKPAEWQPPNHSWVLGEPS